MEKGTAVEVPRQEMLRQHHFSQLVKSLNDNVYIETGRQGENVWFTAMAVSRMYPTEKKSRA